MEASGTTPPAEPAAEPPPPPPPTGADADSAGWGWRLLGLLLALALAFACAVMILVATDLSDTPTCNDVRAGVEVPKDGECYDGSSTAKTIQVVLAWPSGILAGIAALVGLFFTITGRRSRLLLQLTAAAIVLGALSILVGVF